MTHLVLRVAPVLMAGAASLLVAGCVVAPAQPYYGAAQPYYGAAQPYYGAPQPYYGAPQPYYGPVPGAVVVAPAAPPPLIFETQVAAPAPGYIWIGGFWSWSSGRHVWTPGRWDAPRPGYRWVPRTWVQGHGGWRQQGGHWERR